MARTLLSRANRVYYNGDPLNDLSLIAFLDKFMEKKPKPNKNTEGRWHGGSQIAHARKATMMMRMQVILAVMLAKMMMMMMMMMSTIPTVRRGRSQMEQAGNHHLKV